MIGKVVDIKKFAIHDGPGIRTTVFLKGCTLSCVWCHNPETISCDSELGYIAKKCISCGECVKVCPKGAQRMESGKHLFERELCIACGKCAEACPCGALLLYGQDMTAGQILAEVLEDKMFYRKTGGGVTLSGGEPLMQVDFCAELMGMLKEEGCETAVDTCGMVPWGNFDKVLPVTGLFLYDVKLMSPELHKRYTGMDNNLVLDNLRRLSECGIPIEIRISLVPGINDDSGFINAAGEFLGGLKHIRAVKILPFNALSRSKYAALGKKNNMPEVRPPSDEEITRVAGRLRTFGLNVD